MKEEDTMNNMGRNIIIWLVFGAALLALFNLFQSPSSTSPGSQLAYSDFIAVSYTHLTLPTMELV